MMTSSGRSCAVSCSRDKSDAALVGVDPTARSIDVDIRRALGGSRRKRAERERASVRVGATRPRARAGRRPARDETSPGRQTRDRRVPGTNLNRARTKRDTVRDVRTRREIPVESKLYRRKLSQASGLGLRDRGVTVGFVDGPSTKRHTDA